MRGGNAVLILATIAYEAQSIPKGCRKPRTMPFSTDVAVEVTDADDAPVACEVSHTAYRRGPSDSEDQDIVSWRPYRAHAGGLWTDASIEPEHLAATLGSHVRGEICSWRTPQHEAERSIQLKAVAWAARHVAVAGRIWEPVDEPCIVVENDGGYFYRRHGHYLALRKENHELARVDDGLVFRLDELDAAVATCARLNDNLEREVQAAPFVLDEHVRAIRPDLLTRPRQLDYQAQCRYRDVLRHIHKALSPTHDLTASVASLTDAIRAGHTPTGCDAATAMRLQAVLSELDAIVSTRTLAAAVEAAVA